MTSRTENGAETFDSSSDTIELRQIQEPEMKSRENDLSTSEITHQSVNEQIRLATEPILRQVQKLCAPLAN